MIEWPTLMELESLLPRQLLPKELLLEIMCFLRDKDFLCFAMTCRYLYQLSQPQKQLRLLRQDNVRQINAELEHNRIFCNIEEAHSLKYWYGLPSSSQLDQKKTFFSQPLDLQKQLLQELLAILKQLHLEKNSSEDVYVLQGQERTFPALENLVLSTQASNNFFTLLVFLSKIRAIGPDVASSLYVNSNITAPLFECFKRIMHTAPNTLEDAPPLPQEVTQFDLCFGSLVRYPHPLCLKQIDGSHSQLSIDEFIIASLKQWLTQFFPNDAGSINTWCDQPATQKLLISQFTYTYFKSLLLTLKEKDFSIGDIQAFLNNHFNFSMNPDPLLRVHIDSLRWFSKDQILSGRFSLHLLRCFSSFPQHLKKELFENQNNVFPHLDGLRVKTRDRLNIFFKELPCFSSKDLTLQKMNKIKKTVYQKISEDLSHIKEKNWTIDQIVQLKGFIFNIPKLFAVYSPSDVLYLQNAINFKNKQQKKLKDLLTQLNAAEDNDLKWILDHLKDQNLGLKDQNLGLKDQNLGDALIQLKDKKIAVALQHPYQANLMPSAFDFLMHHVDLCKQLFTKPFTASEFISKVEANRACLLKLVRMKQNPLSSSSYSHLLMCCTLEDLLALESKSLLDCFVAFFQSLLKLDPQGTQEYCELLKDEKYRNKIIDYFNFLDNDDLSKAMKQLGAQLTKKALDQGDLLPRLAKLLKLLLPNNPLTRLKLSCYDGLEKGIIEHCKNNGSTFEKVSTAVPLKFLHQDSV